jgi:cell division cycle 14
MHEVVPGKLIAMRGPVDLTEGTLWRDTLDEDGDIVDREFDPRHFIDILLGFNVKAVIRLDRPRYHKRVFTEHGIAVADLSFDDLSNPPLDVVAKFLVITEGCRGAVAVHSEGGLGRTGTLVALYLMKNHGFTAREAIGWLRIVRPGSVIGPQQGYLCEMERAMWQAGLAFQRQAKECQA